MENGHLPSTNADGVPIVPMTAAQKYLFDLKGWICLPALLTTEELEPILEHQWKFLKEPESLPPEERNAVGGPSQILLDHPVIVGMLNEVLSYQPLADEELLRFSLRAYAHRPPHVRSRLLRSPRGRGLFQLLWQLTPLSDAAQQDPRRPDQSRLGAERSAVRRRYPSDLRQPQDRL